MKRVVKIPKDLEGCFKQLKTFEGIEEFKVLDESAVGVIHHHALGRSLRNEWNLWKGPEDNPLVKWFNSIGITHADDMSGIIIQQFHRTLNSKELTVTEQVKEYQEFWAESERNGEESE